MTITPTFVINWVDESDESDRECGISRHFATIVALRPGTFDATVTHHLSITTDVPPVENAPAVAWFAMLTDAEIMPADGDDAARVASGDRWGDADTVDEAKAAAEAAFWAYSYKGLPVGADR
jgi:hypothetical protein